MCVQHNVVSIRQSLREFLSRKNDVDDGPFLIHERIGARNIHAEHAVNQIGVNFVNRIQHGEGLDIERLKLGRRFP